MEVHQKNAEPWEVGLGQFKVSARVRYRLSSRHRQQCRDVVHHRLQSGANRLKSSQSQQVQSGGSQRGHHAGPIAPEAVGILTELGVTDPVPALNAPAFSHQFQQGFWCCACQATVKTGPALCIIKCYIQLVSQQDWAFSLSASPFRLIASPPVAALLGLFANP